MDEMVPSEDPWVGTGQWNNHSVESLMEAGGWGVGQQTRSVSEEDTLSQMVSHHGDNRASPWCHPLLPRLSLDA